MYASANDNFGHHLHYLLRWLCERGCRGVSGHLHGYVEQEEGVKMKFLQL